MNIKKVIVALKAEYPGKNILRNLENGSEEIVCEIEPTTLHQDYSVAMAIVGRSLPHFHRKSEEVYEVVKGTLTVYKVNKKFVLKKGETIIIEPLTLHWVEGNETWFLTYSKPGWTLEDHIIAENER